MSALHRIDDQAVEILPWVVGVRGFGMFKDLPADMRHRVIEAHTRRAHRLRAAAFRAILRRALAGLPTHAWPWGRPRRAVTVGCE